MARRPRIVVAGGLYHVYNRVASGEAVFSDGNEARDFVELIRYVKKRDSWKVLAWCVMSNHFHRAPNRNGAALARDARGSESIQPSLPLAIRPNGKHVARPVSRKVHW